MKTVTVKAEQKTSHIHVGETLNNVYNYLPKGQVIIITDETVKQLYQDRFPKGPVITIGSGEGNKTLGTLEMILRELIRLNTDRQAFILGIGGGIVCDVTGFAASTYMRGLRFGFVSTTLLSQVDASVGGKNGVNLDAYKNMVGVFNQPEFVICDTSLLATLPEEEICNGLSEIVKHALISDASMFEFLEHNAEKALRLDPEVITRLVTDSVIIKAGVVQRDEREAGERRKLNFGHTIGHALEKLTQASHGKAVSMGMVAAANFSRIKGLLTREDCHRIKTLLEKLHLPVRYTLEPDLIINAVGKDKKRAGTMLYFVLLSAIGQSLVQKISYDDLEEFIQANASD